MTDNISIIKSQHQTLVAVIHDTLEYFTNNPVPDRERGIKLIKALLKIASHHLKTEEAIMRNNSYFDYANHKQVHEDFVSVIDEAISLVERGENPIKKLKFFMNWITDHISIEEEMFEHFLK